MALRDAFQMAFAAPARASGRKTGRNATRLCDMAGLLFAGFALSILAASPSPAQTNGRLTIVVPFAAGGGIDVFARLLGDEIRKDGKTTVLIEDKPGASSMIGTNAVAQAKPDGGTILISSNSTLIAPALRHGLLDPLTALEPVCMLTESPQLIVVNADSPYHSLKDLIAAARAKPGQLTLGSNGPASTQQLAAEMFKHTTGIDMTYVPFGGGAPAINALLGGHITAVVANDSELHGQIDAGKLRPLATTAAKRIPTSQNVPTVREEGIDFDMSSWQGVAAPAKTPPQVVSALAQMLTHAIQSDDLRQKLIKQRYVPTGVCGPQLHDVMRQQMDMIVRVAKQAGISLD